MTSSKSAASVPVPDDTVRQNSSALGPIWRTPARCLTLTQDAQAAGYKLAAPPPGAVFTGGAYLVPARAATRALCRAAAARLQAIVPCPGVLPPSTNPPTCTDGCVSGSTFTLEFSRWVCPDFS